MDSITLTAVAPRETGKKAVKATRNEGRVPCVLYGPSTDPVHFSVPTLDLRPLIHTSETYRVGLALEGEDHEAILKNVDFHPITDEPLHVDFLALTKGQKLTLTIPIHLDGTAPGVKAGGRLSQPLHDLQISSLPKDIPGHVSIDISTMQIGDSLHVGELALGDEIEILTDPVRTIVTITAPRLEVVEDEDEGILGLDAEVAPEGEAPPAEEGEGDEA